LRALNYYPLIPNTECYKPLQNQSKLFAFVNSHFSISLGHRTWSSH